ncbi:MAG: hypothetical protein ACREER_10525 [Alphaproteobacteria bacterium]
MRRALMVLTPIALIALIALGTAPAAAQEFQAPPDFVTVAEPFHEDGLEYLFTVRPEMGAFATLSTIRLSRVGAPVGDPDAWLKGRLSADVGGVGDVGDLLGGPDSPFADPAFDGIRRALPEIFAGIQSLAELPLSFCDGPHTGYNATGAYRGLACAFTLGPVRQFLVLRLQTAGGATYFTEIRTMNERRLRQLLAVADTFTAGNI